MIFRWSDFDPVVESATASIDKALAAAQATSADIETGSDLAISMPTVVGRDGVVCRVPVPLNDDEQHELTASAKALKDIIDSVDFSC